MELCGLNDLGFEGYPFTWSNGRMNDGNIQCRLDRGMASEAFINRFSPIKVVHLPRNGSDHAPLLFELEACTADNQQRRVHLFRFEEAWAKDGRCEDLIKEAWRRSPNHCTGKLQAIQTIDETFKEYRTGVVRKEIKRIEELVKDDNLWLAGLSAMQAYKALEKQRDNMLRTDEILWRQRSRAVWLKDGDRNTKKFHSNADQRRKTNAIKKLKDDDEVWWRGDDHLERLLTSYFSDIFTTSFPSNIEEVCETVKGKLSPEHAD